MKFTVVWSAEAELAEAWLDAIDGSEVTEARAMIDNELANKRRRNGTHVAEGLYLLRVPPLQVLFEINEPVRRVAVVAVRLLGI